MTAGLITLADLPALSGERKPGATITVARLDNKLRDPRYGRFAITQADVDGWKRNLAEAFGGRVAIDDDHSSDRGGGTRASGWITGLEQNGKQVQASVQFTPAGAKKIRDGEYLYISPTFTEDYVDEHGQHHGKALLGAALTNRPVLRKGMPTLSLSRVEHEGMAVPRSTSERALYRYMLDKEPQGPVTLSIGKEARQAHATIVKSLPNGKKKYMFPIPPGDKGHARAALRLIGRALSKGSITAADAAKIRARARGVLGKKSKGIAEPSTASSDSRRMAGTLTEVAKLLDLPEDTEAVKVLAKVTELAASSAASGPSEGSGSSETTGETSAEKVSKQARKLRKRQKKAKRAGSQKQMSQTTKGTVTLSAVQFAELQTNANAGAAAATQLNEERFDNAWQKVLSEGRAAPAQEENLKALYRLSPELAIKTLDSFVPVVPVKPQGEYGAQPGAGGSVIAPEGVDEGRLALHREAQARAKTLARERNIGEDEAYTLAAEQIAEEHVPAQNGSIF